MNATELRTFADVMREIGRKLESQITARTENATNPFQYWGGNDVGKAQSGKNKTMPVSADSSAVSR